MQLSIQINQQSYSIYLMIKNTKNQHHLRQRICIPHLSLLLKKKVVEPEIQVTNKLFPYKKQEQDHQIRTMSSVTILYRKPADQLKDYRSTKQLNRKRQFIDKSVKTEENYHSLPIRLKSVQLPVQKITLVGETLSFNTPPTNFSPFRAIHAHLQENNIKSQKKFLKKGSNIQKQIVRSLLSNQMRRKGQFKQQRYNKNQIIDMVKVFEGIRAEVLHKSQKLPGKTSVQIKKQKQENIQGWQQYQNYQELEDPKYD